MHASVHPSFALCLVGTIQYTCSFCPNFTSTSKLFMVWGGTQLIFCPGGGGGKGLGHIWYSVYKTPWARYRPQFLPNHFKNSRVSCSWWEEEPYWIWVTVSKVKVKFGTLSSKTCWHNTDNIFAQSLSNFTCQLWMIRGGTLFMLLNLGHGVLNIVGIIQITVLVPLPSNLTCKVWMMRGGTSIDFVS